MQWEIRIFILNLAFPPPLSFHFGWNGSGFDTTSYPKRTIFVSLGMNVAGASD
jgi:hypothetical protein